MGRIGIAFRLLFTALKDAEFANRGQRLLDEPATSVAPASFPAMVSPAPGKESSRHEALTLLAVLQREARLIDFLKEDIAPYTDAQVGAAVRDVHRDAGKVLERIFALRPVMTEAEGSDVQVGSATDSVRIRLTGNLTGQPPFRGALRHQGWEATKTQLPEWSGSPAMAHIVAPAEVELR